MKLAATRRAPVPERVCTLATSSLQNKTNQSNQQRIEVNLWKINRTNFEITPSKNKKI
jgi:hypothetical protein